MNNAIPLAQIALESTVFLLTADRNNQPLSIGSGFFVQEDLIVTNLHVIHGARKCSAKLVGQDKMYEIEGYSAINPENDLIILKVKNVDDQVIPLNLGNSDSVHVGELVYAVGNPEGYEGTVSNGIISGIREADKLIQMTTPISPGSSGGPVINSKGEVVGVSVLSRKEGQNLNFAVPSNYVKTLIKKSEKTDPNLLLFAKVSGVKWINEELTWVESEDLPISYHFSLLNQRLYASIKNVECLVIFRGERKELIHLDFVKIPEEIPPVKSNLVTRHSIFGILEGEKFENYDVDDISFAALLLGNRGWDLNDYSLVTPEVKERTKTYEVRVVNFEVIE